MTLINFMGVEKMVAYTFSEEQELFRESIKEFCASEIVPKTQKLEGAKCMPQEIIKSLANFELLGMVIDPEYGGLGTDVVTARIAAEELARADHSCAIPVLFLHASTYKLPPPLKPDRIENTILVCIPQSKGE